MKLLGVGSAGQSRVPPERLLLPFLILVSLVNGLLWTFTIPFNQAPDEGAHFHVVRFIRDRGRLPVFTPDELWLYSTSKGHVESYAAFPPLAYVAGALASRLSDGNMWGARMVSMLSYVTTVGLTFLIARRIVPRSSSIALSAALIVAFLPQFVFTGAYVNSDAVGVAITAFTLWLLLRGAASPTPALMLAVGVCAGALLLTKYTFYAAAAVALALAAWQSRRNPLSLFLLSAGLAGASGWWFVRNWVFYGELVPVRVITSAKAAAGGNTLFVPADHGITLLDLSTRTDFWWASFTSFVGKFGFLSIELHPAYYLACVGLLAVGALGWVLQLWRRAAPVSPAAALSGLAILGGTTLFSMASNASGEYSPQGRYLFAALAPVAVGLALGWIWLGRTIGILRFVPAVATGAVVALNFVSLFGYVIPAHFGGAGPPVVLQVDPPRRSGADHPALHGWAIVEGASSWRPFSPESVIGYRKPVSEVHVYLDALPPTGHLLELAHYGTRRRDVADFYGGFSEIVHVGYRANVALETESAGEQRLFVCAVAARHASACSSVPTPARAS